jgi:hypothetical protein
VVASVQSDRTLGVSVHPHISTLLTGVAPEIDDDLEDHLEHKELIVEVEMPLEDILKITMLLNLGVMRPSKASTRSQVLLTLKPGGAWRFTAECHM